ncbi:DUF1648 domain-containing protein [Saccharopolyspora karakumensis]|uniref:DUF1648 domain-containing protein n=1 Tax=Saccharopolyspora karakumensis TaxID=2530386 RepID=A0A4R5BHD1_9PSEU|nr:DUF1648 domain-containing protein [Saccharopolyspora karakumensis]TDD83102.1 DUF1648 domain-containing protein [Saccharopolyspora karakumensis]
MNHRKAFLVLSIAWTVLVTAALVLPMILLRGRLPDPIATHFSGAGVPDGSTSLATFPLVVLPGWVLFAVFAVVAGAMGERRVHRAGSAAVLGAVAAFFGGITASTLWTNLDHTAWQDARLPMWHVLPVLVGAAVAGFAGWLVGNRGPDEPGAETGETEGAAGLDLEPGRRAVWISSVSSRVLVVVGAAGVLVGVGMLVLTGWQVALPALLGGIVVSALSTVRIRVDEQGVRAAFGPQRFPVRRIRLEQISSARVARHRALEVGGWGYRVLPATTAIMLRGGECLVLRLNSGRDFVISVDKPDRGADLVNALLAERSAM